MTVECTVVTAVFPLNVVSLALREKLMDRCCWTID